MATAPCDSFDPSQLSLIRLDTDKELSFPFKIGHYERDTALVPVPGRCRERQTGPAHGRGRLLGDETLVVVSPFFGSGRFCFLCWQ